MIPNKSKNIVVDYQKSSIINQKSLNIESTT